MSVANSRVVAIVGAGFSGTATAINLLRHPGACALRIYLIERGNEFGRAGNRNNRAKISAAPAASPARFSFEIRPPFARASAIPSEMRRRRSRPARKRWKPSSSCRRSCPGKN